MDPFKPAWGLTSTVPGAASRSGPPALVSHRRTAGRGSRADPSGADDAADCSRPGEGRHPRYFRVRLRARSARATLRRFRIASAARSRPHTLTRSARARCARCTDRLGLHLWTLGGVGVHFAISAPNPQRRLSDYRLDFNRWDATGASDALASASPGIWELRLRLICYAARYKFEVRTSWGTCFTRYRFFFIVYSS